LSDPNAERQNDDDGDGDSTNDESLPITPEQVLEVLACGDFDTEHGAIRWSSNYTFLCSVTQGDLTVMAVYKPRSGERPLWDFPDGTLCQRERAAYLTSAAMGLHQVPPTVLRDGPRGLGSVQFFIDHDPEYNYFSFDESLLPQLMQLSLFDVLVNNADRKGGHCIVDSEGRLWGIDHGIAFHSMHKLRTVIWNFAGQTIPESLLTAVNTLCETVETVDSDYRTEMDQLLSLAEMNAFRKRIDRVLHTKVFPQPGPGPNYPWPPV